MSDTIDSSKVQWDNGIIDPDKVEWDGEHKKTGKVTLTQPVDWSKEGSTLQVGPFDTGMQLSPRVTNFLSGAGKSVVDTSQGLAQLYARAVDFMDPRPANQKTRSQEIQEKIDETKNLSKGLMGTTAGSLGYAAGSLGQMYATGGVLGAAGGAAEGAGLASTASKLNTAKDALMAPKTWAGAATAGAAQGALIPTASDDSTAWNTALGSLGGITSKALPGAIGHIAQPVQKSLDEAGQKAVEVLTKYGIPLDLAQRTGSTLLTRARALLSDNPLTAGAQDDLINRQHSDFNRAVLSTIGVDARAATPDVMSQARDRLSGIYDDVFSRLGVNYSDIESSLEHTLTSARMVLDDSQFGKIQRVVDDVLGKATETSPTQGRITGSQFQNIKQTLDRISNGSDQSVGEFARDLREDLHEGLLTAAHASGNDLDVKALQNANRQWRNMRTIEKAISKDTSANISPLTLANAAASGGRANKNWFYYGGDAANQDLIDLAKSGRYLLPEKVPNSGTALRLVGQLGLQSAIGGIAGGLGGGEWDWKHAAEGAVGGVVAPKVIQKGLNSQGAFGKYLTNGLPEGATRNVLEAASGPVARMGVRAATSPELVSSYADALLKKKQEENANRK